MKRKLNSPKIVTLDIETTALVSRTWGIYDQNVIRVVKRSSVLCVSWKWLHEKKVRNVAQTDAPNYTPGVLDDSFVIQVIRDILDEADVVITQNGNAFDLPILKGRMFEHGIQPPSNFKKIDTKLIAKTMKFESNKLADLVKYAGLPSKMSTGGFDLWEGCEAGDPKAWKKMITYCNNDTAITEKLYLRFRPYMENHPNLNVITNRLDECPSCGNEQLQARGWGYNKTTKYRKYQCVGDDGCGGWSKGENERVYVRGDNGNR